MQLWNIKEINFKNQRYYFFNDIINVDDFNPGLLKIDKKSYKNIDIYYIGYITVKNICDFESIKSVNPLHFIDGEADGHTEEKNGNKYLVSDSTDKKRRFTKVHKTLGWDQKFDSKNR